MQRNDIVKINLNEPLLRSNAGEILATDDRQGNRFGALLHRDGKIVDASGYAVTGYFIRPNGDTVINEGTAQGNLVYVDLAPECYAHEGVFSLAIKVNGPSITSTIRVIDGYVRLTKTERQIAPEGLLPDLEELLGQIAAMENAYTKGANAMIAKLSTPFTMTGEIVRCYPVPDYPLQVITHIAPHRPGKGEPSPMNIRALSPVSEVYLNQNNANEYVQALASPVYGGDYNWNLGALTNKPIYRELDGNEGWYLNQNGDTSYFILHFQDVTGIENKAYMSHYANYPDLAYSNAAGKYNVFRWQNHSSGMTRLCVRPDLSDYDTTDHDGSVAKWKEYLAAQKAAGRPVQIVYFTTAGDEEQGYPETVILSHEGENAFYSALHDTTVTVSGPLDPAYQNAQQDERISDLEESAVSGGGSYTLPIASAETLGGVKVGDGLQMTGDVLGVVPDGDFELITEYEVKESVNKIVLDDFFLKEALITIYIPQSDSTNVLAGNIYAKDANTSLYFSVSDAQHTAGGRYTKIYCEARNGLLRLYATNPTPKEADSSSSKAMGYLKRDGYIRRISPFMGSSKPFTIGTIIKIEGVRANENLS